MSADQKNTGRKTRSGKPEHTPDSATDHEKSEIDDQAVRQAVTASTGSVGNGTRSVLPGPPIPPEVQTELRQGEQTKETRGSGQRNLSRRKQEQGETSMINSNDIKEHMEVVGSDGDHVGTVDHCEGPNIIKLTKSDPTAGGEHHYIPMAWVAHIDQRVHLSQTGNEARTRWG